MDRSELNAQLPAIVDAVVKSIASEPRLQHLNRVFLPNRDAIIESIEQLRQCLFAGYFGAQGLTNENLPYRIGELINELQETLFEQVRCCLRYRQQIPGSTSEGEHCEECDRQAAEIVSIFFGRLPAVREMLASDV